MGALLDAGCDGGGQPLAGALSVAGVIGDHALGDANGHLVPSVMHLVCQQPGAGHELGGVGDAAGVGEQLGQQRLEGGEAGTPPTARKRLRPSTKLANPASTSPRCASTRPRNMSSSPPQKANCEAGSTLSARRT